MTANWVFASHHSRGGRFQSSAKGTALWCPEEDSNLHALRRQYLKLVRLPIPPSGHWARAIRIGGGAVKREVGRGLRGGSANRRLRRLAHSFRRMWPERGQPCCPYGARPLAFASAIRGQSLQPILPARRHRARAQRPSPGEWRANWRTRAGRRSGAPAGVQLLRVNHN